MERYIHKVLSSPPMLRRAARQEKERLRFAIDTTGFGRDLRVVCMQVQRSIESIVHSCNFLFSRSRTDNVFFFFPVSIVTLKEILHA